MKGFEHCLPVSVGREYFSLGGCMGPEREYFSSEWCVGPETATLLLMVSSSEITSLSECVFLGGAPPFLCLLGVPPFLKNLPPPFPPPLPCCLNGLPPDGLLCLLGGCGDGVHPVEEFLLVLHISVQWPFLPQLWHVFPSAGHCPWGWLRPHLPDNLVF